MGTFNPSWPANNLAQWFYGRTANNFFWDVLPRFHNQGSLLGGTTAQWKTFCRQHHIAITDLISSINDAYCNANNIYSTTLITPSRYAYFQKGKYNKTNPENQLSLVDYVYI